jgi:hypothetical protein
MSFQLPARAQGFGHSHGIIVRPQVFVAQVVMRPTFRLDAKTFALEHENELTLPGLSRQAGDVAVGRDIDLSCDHVWDLFRMIAVDSLRVAHFERARPPL